MMQRFLSPAQGYRGRFAPTPSGPLHLGSLLTALASFLQAKQARGLWLLRIDDLDSDRCKPEYVDAIQQQLEAHALHWDESPRLQSHHLESYDQACARLRELGLLYACTCTRAQLAVNSVIGVDGPVYDGRCRNLAIMEVRSSWRLRAGNGRLHFRDRWQGSLARDLVSDVGDFVVRRADGTIGYQLACVVDETEQGITEVVRGADLISSSFRQRLLQTHLGLPEPAFAHLGVVAGTDGRKLSKQNHAAPLEPSQAGHNLLQCLRLLQQSPPAALAGAMPREVMDWALAHWDPGRVPAATQLLA